MRMSALSGVKTRTSTTLRVRLKVSAGVFGCSSLTVAATVKVVGVS